VRPHLPRTCAAPGDRCRAARETWRSAAARHRLASMASSLDIHSPVVPMACPKGAAGQPTADVRPPRARPFRQALDHHGQHHVGGQAAVDALDPISVPLDGGPVCGEGRAPTDRLLLVIRPLLALRRSGRSPSPLAEQTPRCVAARRARAPATQPPRDLVVDHQVTTISAPALSAEAHRPARRSGKPSVESAGFRPAARSPPARVRASVIMISSGTRFGRQNRLDLPAQIRTFCDRRPACLRTGASARTDPSNPWPRYLCRRRELKEHDAVRSRDSHRRSLCLRGS
jgi:hypothetical protein